MEKNGTGRFSTFMANDALGWKSRPDGTHRYKFGERYLSFNVGGDGRRVCQTAEGADGDRPSVAFYGCSYTFGHGIPDSGCFTNLVQAKRPDLRIYNMGEVGYETFHPYDSHPNEKANIMYAVALLGFMERW